MGSNTLLINFIHTLGTHLNLYPITLIAHQCNMESLVAIGFRMVHPITCTFWMRFVYLRQCHINIEAFIDFLLFLERLENNTDSQNIIYLLKGYFFVLYLPPDGIRTLDSGSNLILQPHLVKSSSDRRSKITKNQFTLRFC